MKKIIQVEKMHCDHCRARVEEALNQLPGVKASVNLKKQQAIVTLDTTTSDEQLIQAIEEAGSSVKAISERKGLLR